ncbi:MAG: glycosyltransferase family 39 protein [Anaerolineales bacterium]
MSGPARGGAGSRRAPLAFGGWLAVIVGVYLLLGCLYAVRTPLWQAPDEPAHYNYAAYLAREGRLPELQAGDYPAAYLEELKARRFSPELSIASVRYEAHQPPAYYVLAAGLLRLAPEAPVSEQLLWMRLLSVALGAVAVVLLALLARRLFGSRGLALGAAALAAGNPMYVAITASANNDALVVVVLGLVALRLSAPPRRRWTPRASVLLGVLLGLCVLTKLQAYVALPLAAAALLWDVLVAHELSWRQALRSGAWVVMAAAIVAGPWLVRNMLVYGWRDPLGLARHSAVVVGQLRTATLLAESGLGAYLGQLLRTTFQSYWGQFGWMAAPLPERAYLALGLLVLIGAVGLLTAALWRPGWLRRKRRLSAQARRGVALLVCWALLTLASFLWYNLQFVQFQGRYLFPALAPLSIGLAYGLIAAVQRPWPALVAVGAVGGALLTVGLLRGDLPLFSLALCVAAACGLLAARRLPARWRWLAPYGAGLGLSALAAYSLWTIIPTLTP